MTPEELGKRDGKDAFLLNKKIKNPFKWKTVENSIYYMAWKAAYDEEFNRRYNYENNSQ